jgi:2',3'-cyclic-nucleotide 2'-phosphodiesterase (5'-nucleotidase family)
MALASRAMMTTVPSRGAMTTETLQRMRLAQGREQQLRENQRRNVKPWSRPVLRAFVTPTSAPRSLDRVVSLIHSSNRRSTVETCHCPAHPLGGIDREATVLSEIAATSQPCVIVDAGGYLRLPPNEWSKAGAALALEALRKLGVHAVNVGTTDLSGGLSFLKDLQTSYSVPFVSANVLDKGGRRIFESHKIVPVTLKDGEKVRVAIVGVARPPQADAADPRRGGVPADVQIADPKPILDQLISELRKQADLVVLLAFYTREDAPALVKSLDPGARVDAVVCGEFTVGQRHEYYVNNANQIDGVWYLTGGFEGRQIGHTMLELDKDRHVQGAVSKLVEIEQAIPPDPAFTPFVLRYQEIQNDLLNRIL